MTPSAQPKITQKLLVRSAIGIFALAALVMAFRWYKERETDPRYNVTVDTVGWIGAIESLGDGERAIAFKPDGTAVRQPQVRADVMDQDIVWRPDGNCLFFASNRENEKFSMFRWYPDGSAPEMRSFNISLAQGSPYFVKSDADLDGEAHALITAGGKVMELDPKKPALYTVLPPPAPDARSKTVEEGGGSVSPFESVYQRLGQSFRMAKWTPDKKAVVAVMRREVGEVLVYQRLDFADPRQGQPVAIVAGDRIDFDIDSSGKVYYSVLNFQWPSPDSVPPEFVKNGRATVPFRHGIFVLDTSGDMKPHQILAVTADKTSFGDLVVSPKGDQIAFVFGRYDTETTTIKREGLAMVPLTGDAQPKPHGIAPGEIYDPSWSPDGTKIAFARRESTSSRPIYTVDVSDGSLHKVSSEGVFGHPIFSPQTKE